MELLRLLFKNTQFTVKDYDALVRILSRATGVLVTPNTLTETSNLAAYIAEPARTKVFNALRNLIDLSEETYIPSRPASKRHEFLRLGLTDAALITSSSQETVVLTTDLDLYLATVSTGAPAFNFNHIREEYLFD